MPSQPPEVEYPMEPFKWGLPAAQLLNDWRYIDFQTGPFADFQQFGHFANFDT